MFLLDRGDAPSRSPAADAGFAYRRSRCPPTASSWPRRSARARRPGRDPRADGRGARRGAARTQPLAEPNCGSVFKNPRGRPRGAVGRRRRAQGDRAWAARASPTKHANFIVASPGRVAADVLALIRLVSERVRGRRRGPPGARGAARRGRSRVRERASRAGTGGAIALVPCSVCVVVALAAFASTYTPVFGAEHDPASTGQQRLTGAEVAAARAGATRARTCSTSTPRPPWRGSGEPVDRRRRRSSATCPTTVRIQVIERRPRGASSRRRRIVDRRATAPCSPA